MIVDLTWSAIDHIARRHPERARSAAVTSARRSGDMLLPTAPPDLVRAVLAELHPVVPVDPLIRLGPHGDGGYLVPDDLDGITACFSAGVGAVSGFELDCAERGMTVHLADGSVSGPAVDHPSFRFLARHIGPVGDERTITLDDWVNTSTDESDCDLLLQMDIEGDEWSALSQLSDETLRRFRIIVVELHGLPVLLTEAGFPIVAPVLRRLAADHICVHLHPNNCTDVDVAGDIVLPRALEATFLRRDRPHTKAFATQFPHELDDDNCAKPTLRLPPSLRDGGA